jgi:hypothetical protein
VWDAPQLGSIRERPAVLLVAAVVVAIAVVAALALLLHRVPFLLAVLAVAALPFRIPVQAGGTTANLLVPLYVVVAGAALAWAVPRLREDEEPAAARRRGALEWLLTVTLVLYALQGAYSTAVDVAVEQVAFFYVPFALLFVVLRDLEWTSERLRAALVTLVGLALVFAAVGFVEYATRRLLFNPKVIASNQVDEYFRVNSLFFDPNIYGRFLALVMLGVAALLLWGRRPRLVAAGVAVLVVLWGGLVLTLSQTSFAALLAGLAVLAALRFRWKVVVPIGAVAVVAAIVVVLAFPSAVRLDLGSSESLDKATTGRVDLLSGGVHLFEHRPLYGFGSGSFVTEYRERELERSATTVTASHTIPVTVAAEQGVIGLAVYLALLVAALGRLFRGVRGDPARGVLAAAFVALVVHTLTYAAFLEDPMVWTVLALGAALAAQAHGRSRRRAAEPAAPVRDGVAPAG